MDNTDELVRMYLELRDMCGKPDFDQKTFAMKMKNFDSLYKRLSLIEQGEYHHKLCNSRL
jgi:hypothetical protein